MRSYSWKNRHWFFCKTHRYNLEKPDPENAAGKEFEDFGIIIRTNARSSDPEQILEECETLKIRLKQLLKESSSRTCYSCLYKNLPAYITGIRDSYAGKLEEIITDCPDLYDQLKEYLENSQKEDAEKLKLYTDDLLSLWKSFYSLKKCSFKGT